MAVTLKMYKNNPVAPVKPYGFPGDGDNQAWLSDYKYSATRMSSAPTITATLKWHTCLDNEWSTSVFVTYNGERYFVKNTPTSSYDDTSTMYSHSLELVSERAVLDSVYFVDITTKQSEEGDNTQGDSLSDNSEFSFSGDITEFAIRLNNSLNRAGIGGITGYKAIVDNNVTSETKLFSISNQYISDVLKSAYELYEVPYYFVGKEIHFGDQQHIIDAPLEYGADKALLSISKSRSNKIITTKITGCGSDRNIPYYYPNPTPKGTIYLESTSKTATFEVKNLNTFCNKLELDRVLEYKGVDHEVEITKFRLSYDDDSYVDYSDSSLFDAEYGKDVWITVNFNVEHDFVDTYVKCIFSTIDRGDRGLTELYVDSKLLGKDGSYPTPTLMNGMLNCGKLEKAGYTLKLHLRYSYVGSDKYQGRFKFSTINKAYWAYEGTNNGFDITKASIFVIDGAPTHGDKICQRMEYRIDVRSNLMPSEYRRTKGGNRWYIATNDDSRGEWYGDTVFDNEFDRDHPIEYIYNIEDIYPTIKEMLNANGKRIDTLLEIAFDDNDNDEIYPEGHEKAGEYVHPYFFVKLRKTNGQHGFNLFDHAIESEEMKLSFTAGHVASCEFIIGVDDESQKNPVQVNDDGSLKRNKDGDVLCGRWGQEKFGFQDRQQDTENNEVWIALKKDNSTMGVLMPDRNAALIPTIEDPFVLLGIHLPEAYITAAEDKLEQELIKYLKDNNSEKFSFSLKLSSIFLAENPNVAEKLNENSKVKVIYNNIESSMFVSSFSTTVKDTNALPEIDITVSDEIKLVKQKVKDVTTIISSAENKIKDIKNEAVTIKAQVLNTSTLTKDNTNKIQFLQEQLSGVDIGALTAQLEQNTREIASLKTDTGNAIQAVVSADDTLIGIEVESTNNIKTATISAKTNTLGDAYLVDGFGSVDGLATVQDVYDFLNARLSVKIIS